MEDRNQEEGFILVTAIVLLAVLMILGTVSLMKSNIEIKMSAGSVEAEQAFAAMNAGLNETYRSFTLMGFAGFSVCFRTKSTIGLGSLRLW